MPKIDKTTLLRCLILPIVEQDPDSTLRSSLNGFMIVMTDV